MIILPENAAHLLRLVEEIHHCFLVEAAAAPDMSLYTFSPIAPALCGWGTYPCSDGSRENPLYLICTRETNPTSFLPSFHNHTSTR